MSEHWSVNQEEEEQHRRRLFARAMKGDVKAQQELHTTYGVRLWSAQERSKLVYENPDFGRKSRRPRR